MSIDALYLPIKSVSQTHKLSLPIQANEVHLWLFHASYHSKMVLVSDLLQIYVKESIPNITVSLTFW